jgi:hypothetical protein
MRALLPALIALSPVFGAEATPMPVVPLAPQPPQSAPPVSGSPEAASRAELMKAMREVQMRYQEIRTKVDADPDLLKLRTAVEDAQKAYRAKLQELMAKDPAYAEIKAKREELQAKMMAQMGGKPAGPVHLAAPPANSSGQPAAAAPTAAAVPAPVPAKP